MSCNDNYFINQERVIKETWLQEIVKYPNIDYIIYRGDPNIDKHRYNKDSHILELKCEDDINNTFKKTYYALRLLTNKFNYDYIFRTNTSTYINLGLLNSFIERVCDKNPLQLWTSEIYSLIESYCPYPLNLYGRGNGLIISRQLVDIILKEGLSHVYLKNCDDWEIGNILNSYWINKNINYEDMIKSYKHGWYKSINIENDNQHQLCQYNNENNNWDFINQFITIQIKNYQDRKLEEENCKDLYNNTFKENTYNEDELKKIIESNIEYSNNPSIFIGSSIGYINYDKWKEMNKVSLYNLQTKYRKMENYKWL